MSGNDYIKWEKEFDLEKVFNGVSTHHFWHCDNQLFDVEFYYRLFKKINLKYVRILNKKQALILSNQNYSNSITRIRKIDIINFNKLKKKELNLIEKLNDIKINYKLRLIFYWILYKLFVFLSYKFYLKKNS